MFVASPLTMQHKTVRAKTSWYGIRIFFSEWGDISRRGLFPPSWASTKKIIIKGVDLVQSGHHRSPSHLALTNNHSARIQVCILYYLKGSLELKMAP